MDEQVFGDDLFADKRRIHLKSLPERLDDRTHRLNFGLDLLEFLLKLLNRVLSLRFLFFQFEYLWRQYI